MTASIHLADVPTRHGDRYVGQLCKHWAHRFAVTQEGDGGTIDFGDGRWCRLTAGPDALAVETRCDDPERAVAFRDIVERHVQRFAHREGPLRFVWRDGASPTAPEL